MRLITDYKEIDETRQYMKFAAIEAGKSKCKKSQRGVVIGKAKKEVRTVTIEDIIGTGYNKPLIEELCDPCIRENIKDNSRVELCPAIHAEQMAIIKAVRPLTGLTMYHIKVKDGTMRTSGKPSCTVCSRIILESGISEFVLWHEEGYVAYDSEEFNKLSFDYFNLKQP
ncbi:MAG: hypothetical protein V1914_04880 [archaeon]